MFSVIIPAHNEEVVLEECLVRILDGLEPDEAEVVVVANACSDRTADVARSFERVEVVETSLPGKPNALDLGDDRATTFPRLYVDADVVTDAHALRRTAEVLAAGGAELAAPALRVDRSRSSVLVRAYYRIWLRLPWAADEPVGSGVYGLSRAGRGRFGRFHPDGADDWWVHRHVPREKRRCLTDVTFTVPASVSIGEVIRRKSRILAAMSLVAGDLPDSEAVGPSMGRTSVDLIRSDWRRLPDLAVFAFVSVASRLRARAMVRRGRVEWSGDERRRIDPRT